jgi:hypothetical protein
VPNYRIRGIAGLKREILISAPGQAVFALFLFTAGASANLIIIPTFDSSITSLSNAAAVETTIDSAIGMYETTFSNNISVNITFQNMSSGLGQSEFNVFDISYSTFRQALANNTHDPVDLAALALLPSCSGFSAGTCPNPVTGTTDVLIKQANAAALRINLGSGLPTSDGTIGLNTGITNVSRTGTQNPSDYDLLAVTMHEIDEILGLGSTLGLGFTGSNAFLNNDPSPEDFFRYAANGARSFTTNSSAAAYFSVTGALDLAEFDNLGNGDYGDWLSGVTSPQVQDAIGTPGAQVNWGTSEITALEAVGYDLAVPEPSTEFLLLTGLAGGLAYKQYRKARHKSGGTAFPAG